MDSLELPNELWLKVLQYLSYNDRRIMRTVSRRMYHLVSCTDYTTHRWLKICPQNMEEIKTRIEGVRDTADDEQGADVIGGRMMFESVEISGMKCTPEWCFILEHLGEYVKTLRLKSCELFEELPKLMPNVVDLKITSMSEMHKDHPMDLDDFHKLTSVDLLSTELLVQTKCVLNDQLARMRSNQPLERVAVDHNNRFTFNILKLLKLHQDTLNTVSIHFSTTAIAPNLWRDAFSGMTQLRKIQFTGCLPNSVLVAVCAAVPATVPLRVIDLAGNFQLTDNVVIEIVDKWGYSLEELDLMFCVNVTDRGMLALKSLRNTLRSLNIGHCHKITLDALLQGIVGERNTALRYLDMTALCAYRNSDMEKIIERLPRLETLILQSCSHMVTDQLMAKICQNQTDLKVLLLDDCWQITDQPFVATPYSLSSLQRLEVLSLRGCRQLSDCALTNLRLPNLQYFRFGYSRHVTSSGIQELVKNCPSIQHLQINSCMRIDDDACHYIADGLKRLRAIYLNNCKKLSEDALQYMADKVPALKQMASNRSDLDIECIRGLVGF